MNVSIHYTIKEIATVIGATILGNDNDHLVNYLLLDSRKLVSAEGTIFFSLNNEPFTSNKIVDELYLKGVNNFVVQCIPEGGLLPGASYLLVENALAALQGLASHRRCKYRIPVIGITGSNGKTIVKEWLYQLLQQDFNISRSPRSYNSQVGVPLSIFQLNKESTLGIFEAGISQLQEMASLEKMIRPTIGVLTNIGDAHSEGFENITEKIREKLLLFKRCETVIYCSDNEVLEKLIKEELSEQVRLISWGKNASDTFLITSIRKGEKETEIILQNKGKESNIKILFTDEASIENAINCWCVMLATGIGDEVIKTRMLQLHAVEMRLELKQGINNCTLINDSYSSDIHSLQVALDFLNQQKKQELTTVILSDILQSGYQSTKLYAIVSKLLSSRQIHRFIGIGPEISYHLKLFEGLPNYLFYQSVIEFKKDFYGLNFHNETILLKGARIFEFEQISSMLEQKVHQTSLSINLTALAQNLKQYRKLLPQSVKVMAMVKAYSYGSGAFEIAKLLQFHKVDYLAVAYADEGVTLRKNGITIPIMVMNPDESSFAIMVQYFLEPEIYSFKILTAFNEYLNSQGLSGYPVHIKIDTGMHRLGFEEKEIDQLAEILSAEKNIHVQTVFSHLIASQDERKKDLTFKQLQIFLLCCDKIAANLPYNFTRHIANSGAIAQPETQLDMVRIGIGLYGVDSNLKMKKTLKNVMSLQTTISQIKKVAKNETVGYGGDVKLERDSQIATLRIGYADGFHRIFGNGIGKVLIKGRLAPVVGNVCMDMTMVDVTDIDGVEAGDAVEVFGSMLPIEKLAEWSETIPYEIMTNVSQRVKRIYYEE